MKEEIKHLKTQSSLFIKYCLKCRKNTESKSKICNDKKTEEKCFYQNVQCVICFNSIKQVSTRYKINEM